MLPTFLQSLTLQEAFETVVQITEELKRTEFDGSFSQKKKPCTRRELFTQSKLRLFFDVIASSIYWLF